jgi:hypothetical protein
MKSRLSRKKTAPRIFFSGDESAMYSVSGPGTLPPIINVFGLACILKVRLGKKNFFISNLKDGP